MCAKARPNAPIVWIEAGIHANEWIATPTVTYLINQLVNKCDRKNRKIVNNLNIHILPMANPDGYEYSRKYDRDWRKNRSLRHELLHIWTVMLFLNCSHGSKV